MQIHRIHEITKHAYAHTHKLTHTQQIGFMDSDSEPQNNVGTTTEQRADTGKTRNLIYYRMRWAPHKESNPCVAEKEGREKDKSEKGLEWEPCDQQDRNKRRLMEGQVARKEILRGRGDECVGGREAVKQFGKQVGGQGE